LENVDMPNPVDVDGLQSNVTAVSAGENHTCALLESGGVMCWGHNYYGQLGDGTTTGKAAPVDVSGLSSGISQISAGDLHTCAVTSNGDVKCWGFIHYGDFGHGTIVIDKTPVDVSELSGAVLAVSAGDVHTCALLESGGVACWGRNWAGQLGDGTTADSAVPVGVSGLSSGVMAISSGDNHTCVLLETGDVECWGHNAYGQLGIGTTARMRTIPAKVSGLPHDATALSAGGCHSCALLGNGDVMCWGLDLFGQASGYFNGYPTFVIICE